MPRRRRRAGGEGTVYQRPDGLWTTQVTISPDPVTGKQRRKTAYGKTERECIQKAHDLKQQHRDGLLDQPDMLVGNVLDFWLEGIKPSLAPGTQDRYTEAVRTIRPYLAKVELSKLKPVKIVQVLQAMEQAGLSASVRRRCLIRLRQALRNAVRSGLISSSPAAGIPLPRHTPAEMHPLTVEEVGRFLEANRADRRYPLYVVAIDTGARQGELFALTWPDWDATRHTVRLIKSLEFRKGQLRVKESKTKASRRTLEVSADTAAVLEQHRERLRAEGRDVEKGLMFPAARGGYFRKPNFWRDNFQPALKRAGLSGVRFNDLRHTTASLLLAARINLKVVAERLGHSNPNTTLRVYAHVIPGLQAEAASVMGAIIRPAPVAPPVTAAEAPPGDAHGGSNGQAVPKQ